MRLLLLLPLFAGLLPADEIRFNRDIRPILSNNCFQCHGPDQKTRMAGLRLDVREDAVAAAAIAPGDPEASKLVQRVFADSEALRMPPAYADKRLSEEQKELLERWIEQGADYEGHWAYEPVERPAGAPRGAAAIDFFIERKLAERGLEPVGEADRRTLARRLSLDLTGLPPDPERVERFVADTAPEAYETLLDELLASPHFGERMAVHWLDLVRYADTTGYHNDVPINVYPYRDYVIRSFNENKPFDEFTREQLAGDLIPDATPQQLVASAYNRLNRLTTEGGAQPKEYLAKYSADRVRTTATVWLGSTLGCAECHDHKFDPFLTKDFYQMGAFFADLEERGVFSRTGDYGPRIRILDERSQREAERLEAAVAELRSAGEELLPTAANRADVEHYWEEIRESWSPLQPVTAFDDCSDPDIEDCEELELSIRDDVVVAQPVEGELPRESVHVIETPAPRGRVTALALEIGASHEAPEFYLSELRVELLRPGARPEPLDFSALEADGESEDNALRDTLDGEPHSGWAGDPCLEGPRRALYVLDEPLEVDAGATLRFTLVYNGRQPRRIAGRTRLLWTAAAYPELAPSPGLDREALFTSWTERKADWREIRRLERQHKALWDFADEAHVSRAVEEPRTMRILPRGNWMDDSGEVVEPQAPGFLGEIPAEDRRLTRLDLADWMVDESNPLTARVFVNRLWRLFFGVGLSKRLDDLGSQGEPPTHPELLDWLAAEFMESGWDVKHLIRTMLLSDAYRRSSDPTPELVAKDPYNRYFGRQAFFRLDAEMIRDAALAVSGLLERELGGPSVKPYQPAGYYGELNFPRREYQPDLDERQYRRGLYTHWQRTFLHPSLMAFDAPTREECTAERAVSNTPLQSLALLNDPSFVEAAQAFAARILEEGGDDPIDFAFRQAFTRPVASAEREVVEELLEARREQFAAEPERARQLLAVGLWQAPKDIDPVELAAWTDVARALLNKHELITRY